MSLNYLKINSEEIKKEAKRIGFSACGIAKAEPIERVQEIRMKSWLHKGYHSEMEYLNNNQDKRYNPQLLVEGGKTIISVALNYYPKKKIAQEEYQLSWYAYGKDYHYIVKEKLNQLLSILQQKYNINGRSFCDTAPILERYWAVKAGLGWIGKNNQLIIPNYGNCLFLGELIIDQEVDHYDTAQRNRCGNCTLCLDNCPTKALQAPYELNSNRCLSYLTIEHRGEFKSESIKKIGNKIFGCDRCITICPWNRFAQPTEIEEFEISNELLNMKHEDWHNLTVEKYRDLFRKSAVKRAKYEGLMRNINAVRYHQG